MTPLGSIGRFGGIAHMKFIAIRETKSGATFVSRIVSLLPDVVTPEGRVALPAMTLSAPTMSLKNVAAGDCIFGASARSIARA